MKTSRAKLTQIIKEELVLFEIEVGDIKGANKQQFRQTIIDKIKGTRGRMSRSKALRNDPERAILSCLRVFVDFKGKEENERVRSE